MRRSAWVFCLIPLVAWAAPAGREGPRKETPAELLRKAMDNAVTLEVANQPLSAVLQQIADQAKVAIVLDQSALLNLGDPAELNVSFKGKEMKLRLALRTVTGQYGLSFAIVGDHIFVSSEEVVNQRQLRQRVNINLDGVPLSKALKDIAQQTATNLIIDPRKLKQAEDAKVTLQLDDVPLETAIRLMAELASLKPARMGNVLFVTSEERADKLKLDADPATPAIPGFGLDAMPLRPLPLGPMGGIAPPAPPAPPVPAAKPPMP